jgi:putative transposase
MLGFQPVTTTRVILGGIKMVYMMRKQQAKDACNLRPSLAEQFELRAARACYRTIVPFASPLRFATQA